MQKTVMLLTPFFFNKLQRLLMVEPVVTTSSRMAIFFPVRGAEHFHGE